MSTFIQDRQGHTLPQVGGKCSVWPGAANRRGDFHLDVGAVNDARYLWGQWYGGERASMFSRSPDARMRWTGAKAGFYLPCDPAADATLVLTVNLTAHSLPGANRVRVNGAEVGMLDSSGSRTYRFAVPRQLLASGPVVEVLLEIRAFRPRAFGSSDGRELGVAVCAAELCAKGAEGESPATTPLAWQMDWSQAGPCMRRIGKGATLAVPGRNPWEFNEAVAQALLHSERLSGTAQATPHLALTESDGIYATRFTSGVLYYNACPQPRLVHGVEVPAGGIAWQACQP